MTDLEIQKLEIFVADEVMKNAVKKVLFAVCDLNDLLETNNNYSNAQLGSITRSYRGAQKLLKMGFKSLEQFTKEKPETPIEQIQEGL